MNKHAIRPIRSGIRRSIRATLNTGLLASLVFMSSLRVTQAGSATWNLDPGSHYWNDPNNWTPATVPSGPNDTATFAASNQAVIALTEGGFEVNGISFPSGASAFAIHAYPHSWLNVSGTGITNNSGIVQNFVAFGAGAGFIAFLNGASAGELTVFTARANTLANSIGGLISFGDSSTAGNGTFYIEGGAVRGGYVPGKILFSGTSTAGNATFMTQGGKRPYKSAGYIQFRESSSAGHGTFITHGSAPSDFNSRASTGFGDTSSGGDAIFVSLGGALLGAFGGNTSFSSSSTAGNATLIAEPGVSHGGSVEFGDSADGGTARVVLFGNGQLDISCHSSPGVTIGSIEKGGNVFLGSNNLTVGSNNLSTAFDGRIQDSDGFCGGSGRLARKNGQRNAEPSQCQHLHRRHHH